MGVGLAGKKEKTEEKKTAGGGGGKWADAWQVREEQRLRGGT